MEATRDWRQIHQVVEGVSFIVVQDDHVVLEEVVDVFLGVEIQPVLEAHPAELLVHLLLFEEADLLCLLAVPLPIELDELIEEILPNLL